MTWETECCVHTGLSLEENQLSTFATFTQSRKKMLHIADDVCGLSFLSRFSSWMSVSAQASERAAESRTC